MGKYKVGDKVRIKSLEWWNAQPKDSFGDVITNSNCFIEEMSKYCGNKSTITEIGIGSYRCDYHIAIDGGAYFWPEEAFEDVPTNEQSTLYTDLAKAINKVVTEHHQSVMVEEIEGGIIIKPIEEKEEDLPIDTPVMVGDNVKDWLLRYYAGDNFTFVEGLKSRDKSSRVGWHYIIPFDKFDPTNIEESLKHNIVKHG